MLKNLNKRRKKRVKDVFQRIQKGEKPILIGLGLTQDEYNMIAPYIKDPGYLLDLRARIESIL